MSEDWKVTGEVVQGIQIDIGYRWQEGMAHNPKSEAAIRTLADLDYYTSGNCLDISVGGDGDNGETMMYLLDIYYDALDAGLDFAPFMAEIKRKFDETPGR